jgi:hypothetical protein
MASLRPVITRMRGQQAGRPQLMGYPNATGLAQARETSHALASRVITASRPARGRSSSAAKTPNSAARSQAPHHGLLAHPDLPRNTVSRWGVEIGKDYASPLHPARRFGP